MGAVNPDTPDQIRTLVDVAEALAREAGALILDGRRRHVSVAATKSSAQDVVTAMDLASEALLRRRLAELRPDDGILGEEEGFRAGTSGIMSLRSTGVSLNEPQHLSYLAMAYAELGQPDDARRCIDDAIDKVERSKEKWCEAEVNRIAGEVALKSPAPDTEKAEKYFDRALAVARQQRAKSWELRAAMSMARLWRDQGKRNEARDLLAPVYGWFTEGFDTLDLKEARLLLDELAV